MHVSVVFSGYKENENNYLTQFSAIWKAFRKPEIFSFSLGILLLAVFAYFAFALPSITYVSPTLSDNATTGSNWVFVNLTSSENLNQSLLEWGNSTGFTNVTMANGSMTNWYKNMTDLADWTYNYTVLAENTTGGWNQAGRRFITIDTTQPFIGFVSPTDNNTSFVSRNWTYINTTITDSSPNSTGLIDFNRSLVGWWRFNREAGENDTLARDWSSYGNNGTMTNMNPGIDNCTGNCSGWTANGKFGYAIRFDGANDYIRLGNLSNLSMAVNFSVSAWIYRGNNSDVMAVFSKGQGAVSGHATQVNNTGYHTFVKYGVISIDSPVYSNIGVWEHVVWTVESDNRPRLYVNGNLAYTSTDANSIIGAGLNAHIGAENGSSGSIVSYFNGSIDDVRIFSRALSPEEINASYNAGLYRLYHNFTNLIEGTYTYIAYAQDLAGNVNQTETRTLAVDTILPTTTIQSPTNTTYNTNSIWFNMTGSETLNWSGYSLDGAPNITIDNTTGNWNKLNSTMTDGIHYVKFYANDSAGNMNTTAPIIYFTVDTTLPLITFISPTKDNNSYVNTNYTYINVSISDTLSPNNLTSLIDFNRSLVGWWRFNREAGENDTFVRDWSSWGNNGTCSGTTCPIYMPGAFGKAAQMDGIDDYLNIEKKRLLNHAQSHLNVPTYDGSNQTVHPDIYYNATGWNGWKYWMVMTPYPNKNDDYENPSIVVSNDGITWSVPNGLTNPINSSPNYNASSYYNDPDMVYYPDKNSLYVWWNDAGSGKTRIMLSNSSDGITWAPQRNIFNVSDFDVISPSVVFKNGVFTMWVVNSTNVGCGSSNIAIQYYNSTDGIAWTGPYSTSFIQNFDANYLTWHINVEYMPSKNQYWMIITAAIKGYCSNANRLYFANSSDGIIWEAHPYPLLNDATNLSLWDSNIYRASFLYNETNDLFRVWYSATNSTSIGSWFIGYTEANYSGIAANLNYTFFGKSGGTICTRVNLKSYKESGGIGDRWNSTDRDWYELNFRIDGKMLWGCNNNGTETTVYGGTTLNLNTWYHVCTTYNASGIYKYLNGVLDDYSTTSNCTNLKDSTYGVKIGNYYQDTANRYTNGTFDDILIFSRALSEEEINASYNAGVYRLHHNFTGLAEGAYNYTAYAQDLAGNVNQTETRVLTVDTTPPAAITYVGPTEPDGANKSQNYFIVNVSFTETNPDTCTLNVNNANLTMTRSGGYCNRTMSGQSDGTYTYQVFVNDSVGNLNASVQRTIRLDTVAPSITVQSPLNISYGTNSIWFNATLSETGSWFGYSLDGAANVTMTNSSGNWNFQNASMTAGVHSVKFYANDTAGNMNNTAPTIYFTVTGIGTCQALTVPGIYALVANVSSAGTCFTISANNVTLDANGYWINYSQSATGYAVYDNGYNFTTIKNANIVQQNESVLSAHTIYFSGASNGTIQNNTVAIWGWGSISVLLRSSSNSNTLSNNTIITSGPNSRGVYLQLSSDSNTLSNNNITTSGTDSEGIYLSSSSANTILNNNISTLSTSISGVSIFLLSSSSNTLSNNNVITSGEYSYGVLLRSSSSNTLSNNAIATSSTDGSGILLDTSSNANTLFNNNITTSNISAYGIYLWSSSSNNITGGSVITRQAAAYYLRDINATNNFTNTNFTALRNITFADATSWFNYNNDSSGNIWIKTSLSAAGSINRTLVTWSQPTMKWNDATNGTGNVTANYSLSGLLANTQYKVYNTSVGTQENPYNITTDSSGVMSFNITLNGSTELLVNTSTRPTVSLNSPSNSLVTNDATQIFDCSATSSGALTNITLYGNWSGWSAKNSTNITGTANSSQWVNTLADGAYIWNCLAFDDRGNSSFYSSNYTLTVDTIPPMSVTNLSNKSRFDSWIYWNWTSPDDSDFNYSEIRINGTWKTNTSLNYYNATGLNASTWYEISIRTVDIVGNVNQTWVNSSAATTADITPPAMSNISASSMTTSSAIITWTAGEPSNSTVRYGTTTAKEMVAGNATLLTSHSVPLSGLSSSTLYYYNVTSCDSLGNCAGSEQYNFTTSAAQVYYPTSPSGGGATGGSASPAPVQNQTNQTANVTAPVQSITNITAPATAPAPEPEIKSKARQKIDELKAKINPEDTEAKEKIESAESAYAAGEYQKAYDEALAAESLIIQAPEKKSSQYVTIIISLVLVPAIAYCLYRRRDYVKKIYANLRKGLEAKPKGPVIIQRPPENLVRQYNSSGLPNIQAKPAAEGRVHEDVASKPRNLMPRIFAGARPKISSADAETLAPATTSKDFEKDMAEIDRILNEVKKRK